MPVTQDRLTKLREFGLSEYAARAYLALLDLGIAEARDVSSISKVPQAKIYHVLEQLHEKGLVVILPEFPKKYAPVPFEDYLHRIFEEHTKAAASIDAERSHLAELFRVVGDTDVGNRGFFTVIRGRRNVLQKMEEMVAHAKRDVVLLGTMGSVLRASHLSPALRQARERGVLARVLVPIDAETLPRLAPLVADAEVRARELDEEDQSRKVAIVIVDGATAFLIHFVPDDANLYAGKDIGVFTDQEAMVAAIDAIVAPHWSRAAPFEARRATLVDGREPEFTRIHADPEAAWRALDRALRAGTQELCVLDGSDVPSAPDPVSLADLAHRAGARFRGVLAVADLASVERYAGAVASRPGSEARHVPSTLLFRHWFVDDREAFIALARKDAPAGSGAGDLVIHTNNPAVLGAMRAHFESIWAAARTLDARREELTLFPDLRPGDVGIGVLFTLLDAGVLVARPEGRILMCNPAGERILGRPAREAVGRSLFDIAAPGHEEGMRRAVRGILAAKPGSAERLRRFEGNVVRGDGEERHVDWTVSLIETGAGGPHLLAIAHDSTERKRAQEEATRAHVRIIRTYETMPEAFLALDNDWRIVYTNPVTERMNTSGHSYVGAVLWDAFPDLKDTKFDHEYHRAMRDRVPVRFEEHYPRMSRWFEVQAYPTEEGLSIHFRDVTARREREALGRASEERFRRAFDDAPIGMLVAGPDGRVVDANPALAALLGRDVTSITGRPLAAIVRAEDHAALAQEVERVVAGKEPRVALEVGMVDARGSTRRARLSLSLVQDPDGRALQLVGHVQPA